MHSVRILVAFILVSYLPGLFFVEFSLSSMAGGLIGGAGLAAAILLKPAYFKFASRSFAAGIIFFAVFVSYVLLVYLVNESPKALTVLAAPFLGICAYIIGSRISETDVESMRTALVVFVHLTLGLGWLALLGITQIGAYSQHVKAVAPFSEQSHYALCVGVFTIMYCLLSKAPYRFFVVLNVVAQALLFPNLTLFVFGIILAALLLTTSAAKWRILVFAPAGLAIAFWAYGTLFSNEYFSERLSLKETNNLTALVWIQGWELAKLNWNANFGTGLGLQMLGEPSTAIPDTSYTIQALHAEGRALNVQDGGFLAAKLLAELGLIGLLLILVYLRSLVGALNGIRHMRSGSSSPAEIMYYGIIVSMVVELFLRGYGYFSPGLFLFGALIVARNKSRRAALLER